MKTDRERLRNMLNDGLRDLSDDELKKLVELELSKDESEIDTDFIDLCFELMEVDYSRSKRIAFTKPVKIVFIAAAVLVLMVSGISVVASSNGKNPIIKKLPYVADEVVNEEDTVDVTTLPVTTRKSYSGVYYDSSEDVTQEITVPDLCTGEYTETSVLENAELNDLFEIEFEYGNGPLNLDNGVIYSQSLEAGESVEKGSKLVLTVNIYKEELTVPDYVGLTLEEINSIEETAYFNIVVSGNNGSNPTDVIISQNPEPGTLLQRGATVNLVVQTTPANESTTDFVEE